MHEVDKESRTMAMLCHLSSFSGFIIPFGNILGPLLIWLLKKESSSFVDDQGREAINFNITVMLAYIVSGILTLVLIGIFLLIVVFLIDVILTIIATIKANEGQAYRYPFNIRFL